MGRKSKVRELAETFFGALGLALVLRATMAEACWIPTPSMAPTLKVGDRLVVEKLSYRFHSPRRGDIVVFNPPQTLAEYGLYTQSFWVKRVIGLPGERLSVRDGKVLIDGKELSEPYLEDHPLYRYPETVIPDGMVFVMGDNRNNSADSHLWGALPIKNIVGRAQFCIWPLSRLGAL